MASKGTIEKNIAKANHTFNAVRNAGDIAPDRAYPFKRLSPEQRKKVDYGIDMGEKGLTLTDWEIYDEFINIGFRIGQRRREAEEYENNKRGR